MDSETGGLDLEKVDFFGRSHQRVPRESTASGSCDETMNGAGKLGGEHVCDPLAMRAADVGREAAVSGLLSWT